MTVLYNDRTLPLSLHGSNADLTTGLNIGWDFTGVDASHEDGVPWISPAAATMTKTGTIPLVTRNGEPGRHMDNNSTWYKKTGTSGLNLQTGTGDFTISCRISMPVSAPADTGKVGSIFVLYGGSGSGLSIDYGNVASTGGYVQVTRGASTIISATASYYLLPGRQYVITVKRSGNTLSLHQTDLSNGTYKLQGSVTFTHTLDSSYAADAYACWVTNANCDLVVHAVTHWTVALSDTVIQNTLNTDYWSMNANNAIASTISITSPTTGSTIGQTASVSGTSAGTVPTGVQVQFNGGSWITLSSFSYNAPNWTGTASGLSAGTGNLIARKANETAVQSSAIANITVSSDSITIGNVVARQSFQIDYPAATKTIALSGTYVGIVTGIEWRHAGGSWTALTGATIGGGNWSGSATSVPKGSGALEVRFANNTSVMASVPYVIVGDIWVCGGQSNMQGRGATANSYTPSNGLIAAKYTHDFTNAAGGSWADLTDPYDAQSSALGSWIPLLATKILAAGTPVAFVPCAIGATDIASWQKGQTNYNVMLARFNAVGGARGLLWLQGESNASSGTSQASYEASLTQFVNDWYADTGTKVFVIRIHEGGPGTPEQHNAIREAQTLVGTNHDNAVLGPDLVGIEPTDVHFLNTVQLQEVADRVWPMLAIEYYNMRKAEIPLVSTANSPQANKRNIKYAFFDQTTPDLFAAPVDKGGTYGFGAVTGADGVLTIPLPNTTKTAGQTGSVVVSDSDGNTATVHKAFCGPVVVS